MAVKFFSMKIKKESFSSSFQNEVDFFFNRPENSSATRKKKSTNRAVPLRTKRDQLNFERARVRPAAAAVVVLSVKARARHRSSSSSTALVAGVIEIDLCQG